MSVLVLGTFDGVHIAHRKLIKEAKKFGNKVVACTFSAPFSPVKVLTDSDEKVCLLKEAGADEVFMQETASVKNLLPEEYIKMLTKKFMPTHIVAGFNHRFGKNASGDLATLSFLGKKYGFVPVTVPPVSVEGEIVSSTHIRSLLSNGEIEKANLLLGRFYSLSGQVIQGRHIGTEINFPTANISLNGKKILPEAGVYATLVKVKSRLLKGMTNIGTNPTVASGNSLSVETHILGFDCDIYNKEIEISFLKKIRDDKKFESLEELEHQLSQDKLLINAYIDTLK